MKALVIVDMLDDFVTGALANDGSRLQGMWGRGSQTQGTYWGDKR